MAYLVAERRRGARTRKLLLQWHGKEIILAGLAAPGFFKWPGRRARRSPWEGSASNVMSPPVHQRLQLLQRQGPPGSSLGTASSRVGTRHAARITHMSDAASRPLSKPWAPFALYAVFITESTFIGHFDPISQRLRLRLLKLRM